jgi:hypothetical protein
MILFLSKLREIIGATEKLLQVIFNKFLENPLELVILTDYYYWRL